MQIRIKVKTVYGKDLIYPADENAELFAQLMGKKTLTFEAIRIIQALGFEIIIIHDNPFKGVTE